MIHVYKVGGAWEHNDIDFDAKSINESDQAKYVKDGWVLDLDSLGKSEIKEEKPEAKEKLSLNKKANKDDNKG